MPRTVWLKMDEADADMKMVLGEDLEDKKFNFLHASPQSPWHANVRAIGFHSKAGNSFLHPWRSWSHDFNQASVRGALAVFNSGSPVISVSSDSFRKIRRTMPGDCKPSAQANNATNNLRPSLECTCPKDFSDFPTISISFEGSGNLHFWSIDFGSDHVVCIPPEAYIVRDGEVCKVAIVADGNDHSDRPDFFGMLHMKKHVPSRETIVLGVPFFRAMGVVYDGARHEVGLSAEKNPNCVCTDPKNWWFTGRRLSIRRIILSLTLAVTMALYAFIGHSRRPAVDQVRIRLRRVRASAATGLQGVHRWGIATRQRLLSSRNNGGRLNGGTAGAQGPIG